MIKKGIPELKFPPYEKIKALDKNKEYEFILFYTGITETYGRFTVHEDGKRKIIFDLIEDGYSDTNDYTMSRRITKKEYQEICNHAQNCYNNLFSILEKSANNSKEWIFD